MSLSPYFGVSSNRTFFLVFYHCNFYCGNFYVNDKARRENILNLYVEVRFKFDPFTYIYFFISDFVFVMIIAMISIDLDRSAKHWKSSYMRELIIVIVEPFFLVRAKVCFFYPLIRSVMKWFLEPTSSVC